MIGVVGGENASQMKEEGNGLCDGIAECGTGGDGRRGEERTWMIWGSRIPSVAGGPPHYPVRRLP